MPLVTRDGAYDKVGGLEVGPPEIEYPFQQNGDMWSLIITRTYKQTPTAWRNDRLLATYLPGVKTDREYSDAYLLKETIPATTPTGLYVFTRTFGRVPRQQVVPGSIRIPMPSPTNAGGISILFGTPSSSTAFPNGYQFSTFFYGDGKYYTPFKTVSSQAYTTKTTFTVTGHGLTSGQPLLLIASGYAAIYLSGAQWSVVDANTIDGPTGYNFITIAYMAQYSRAAFPGTTKHTRCKRISDFYLPGVTPGINTADDIPLPTDNSDTSAFLDALLAGTGTVNVEVGALSQWRDSPILEMTKTTVNAADID